MTHNGKKVNISSSIDEIAYAHMIAISRRDGVSVSAIVNRIILIDAIEQNKIERIKDGY